jgi:hypothetical protein
MLIKLERRHDLGPVRVVEGRSEWMENVDALAKLADTERTLGYMGEARQTQSASSTAPDLWQLQIIISDGV